MNCFRSQLCALAVAAVAVTVPAGIRAASQAMLPFTYTGRISDYAHVGYNSDPSVEIRAKKSDGTLLAKGVTYASDGFPNNYTLQIPLSDQPAIGFAVVGERLMFEVDDGIETVYSGVIPEELSSTGLPGEVCKCNIILSTDTNANGVADRYEGYLRAEMARGGITGGYDADADYDGDGISNRAEYVAGTSPFDSEDRFSVLQYEDPEDQCLIKLTFMANRGRSYSVQTATGLASTSIWETAEFKTNSAASSASIKYLNTGADEVAVKTIYLIKSGPSRFYRLGVE